MLKFGKSYHWFSRQMTSLDWLSKNKEWSFSSWSFCPSCNSGCIPH